jgi:hypothetical protein
MSHSMYGADCPNHLSRFSLAAIAAVVAHSPIVVSRPACSSSFPNGYERVDIKILEWIRRSQQTDSAAAATRCRAS